MKRKLFFIAIIVLTSISCTKLEQKPYSEVYNGNFYNNRTEVMAAVLRPFTHANAWGAPTGQIGYWRISELSADQLAWPKKGKHGYDGGNWYRLHYHQWTATDDNVWNPWNLMFWGMGFCNNTISDLQNLDFTKMSMTEDDKKSIIAETKALRAWHYLKLMDLYGNIPITTELGQPAYPETKSRAEVFALVEKELKENADLLQPLSNLTIGRVSKAAAYAMLVELYLNAEVWTGTPRWDDCIAACDKLMSGQCGSANGTAPSIEPNIFAPFGQLNNASPENLFNISYDLAGGFKFGFEGDMWHYSEKYVFDADRNGNNGIVVIPSAYNAFANNDLRKKGWMLIDSQYYYGTHQPVLATEEYNGLPLVFVNNIRRNSEGQTGEGSMADGEENSGARFNKYNPGRKTDANYWANDYVLYRLAEIYFAKAEALMRKNGNVATPETVNLINAVRKRAFSATDWMEAAYTTSSLTMDELLAERGREFIFEGKRRQDLIRFDKFTTGTWWDHKPSSEQYKLFAIPYRQLVANPNLKQNPGY